MHRNNEMNNRTIQSGLIKPNVINSYMRTAENNNSENNNKNNTTPPKPVLPPVITNPMYLQGYLRDQIGKFMRVDFLIGTGTFVDKEGILKDVGVDHIVLEETKTGNEVIADLYSIKFVEIPEDQ